MKTVKNILFLNTLYAPVLINVLYILLVIASIGVGIFLCVYEVPKISIGIGYDFDVNMVRYVKEGIALIILGPILSRFLSELLIILFKINEQVTSIANMNNKDNNSL